MNLLNRCYDRFSSFTKFWSSKRNIENTKSDLYFNEESYYSEEIADEVKTFLPPFFNDFCLSLEQKKTCGNERHEKETQHIHAFAADLLYVRKKNLDWCKCWHCINAAREIDCLCCREVDAMLIVRLKSQGTKEASCHPAYMGICLTISHTLALSTCWTKWGWWVRLRFCLFISGLNQVSPRFSFVTQGFRRFPSIFSQARWCNLVYVKCLDD